MPLPPAAADINVAAEQCGRRQRTGDDHGFIFQSFVFEKAASVGDVDGEII